ncbi:MAG TPA: right-handed parallel beta-helix repeat-containing protein [Pyrinomonadaceae bacterium]|nr:right-handed parallel beta-helix repeat-containing protein [Pyrinomonadaceae bacterium]
MQGNYNYEQSINRLSAIRRLTLRTAFALCVIATLAVAAFAQQSQGRVVTANSFPGQDLGAKINAADQSLGTARGEIVVKGGGIIATQVTISPDHVLRLLPGTYVPRTAAVPILMKSRTSLIGSGWESIILESTAPGQFTVISAYGQAISNGTPDSGLLIRDLQVKGANPGFNSAPQAISLGNCSNCTVDKVWVNGTRSIGIQFGGTSSTGHFAENSKVTNCLFTRVASQNLALVNGKNILFEGNRFLASGQRGGPGNTNIDVEPNETDDRIEDVIIRNNFIDVHESEMPTTGNGIVVQSAVGTPHVGPVLIEKNTIIGGSNKGTITNVMSNGIVVFGATMKDVTVRDNVITRTGQTGMTIGGTRIHVTNNRLTDVGGGGTPGFTIDATNSEFVGNTLTYTGSGPADNRMIISERSRANTFQNNGGWVLTGKDR